MRISDWSSDVCSSDLSATQHRLHAITGITRLIGSTQAASTRVDAAFFLRHSAAHRVEEAMDSPFRAVLSPCIGVCTLAEDGYCDGCHRTSTEIASWIHMDDDARLRLMEDVLPERSEEHTSELQQLLRSSSDALCLKKKKNR